MALIPEEDLCCAVCRDVFKDPVVLPCSHSFCNVCLNDWWRQNPTQECPVCKKISFTSKPPCNLVLKNLCESFKQQRDQRAPEHLCSLHFEKLKLFCVDHQQPVCLICRDSDKHAEHRFRPIEEAAQRHKTELQQTLEPLKKKVELQKKVHDEFGLAAEHIKRQAEDTEKQIKKQFQKLRRFLAEEEEARLAALREEEEQKSRMMKDKMDALSRDIAALSDTVTSTEAELRAEDLPFLNNYKAALQRVQHRPLLEDPQLPSGALIDQAQHLGNLAFNIWSSMRAQLCYTPIILDPNSAYPELTVFEDLNGVRKAKKLNLPSNPERLNEWWAVLDSEGFCSGSHSWDADVGQSNYWILGVMVESGQKTGHKWSGIWGLWFSQGKVEARAPPEQPIVIPAQRRLQRVRVSLDWNKGTLTFSDLDSGIRLHAFTPSFRQKMFPLIVTDCEVKILPMKISVMKQPVFNLTKRNKLSWFSAQPHAVLWWFFHACSPAVSTAARPPTVGFNSLFTDFQLTQCFTKI